MKWKNEQRKNEQRKNEQRKNAVEKRWAKSVTGNVIKRD
jgi:hypothetical protein